MTIKTYKGSLWKQKTGKEQTRLMLNIKNTNKHDSEEMKMMQFYFLGFKNRYSKDGFMLEK